MAGQPGTSDNAVVRPAQVAGNGGGFMGTLNSLLSSISSLGDSLTEALEPVVDAGVQQGRQVLQAYQETPTPPPPSMTRMVSGVLGAPSPNPSPQRQGRGRKKSSPAGHTSSSGWGIMLGSDGDANKPMSGSRRSESTEHRKVLGLSLSMNRHSDSASVAGREGISPLRSLPKRPGSARDVRDNVDVFRDMAVQRRRQLNEQLNEDLTESRRRLAIATARCSELEDLLRLRATQGQGGEQWDPSEAEEMLQGQIESLCKDKSELKEERDNLLRRNEELREQVLFLHGEIEEMLPNEEDGVHLEEVEEDSEHSSHSYEASYTPVDGGSESSPMITPTATPGGSSLDLRILSLTSLAYGMSASAERRLHAGGK